MEDIPNPERLYLRRIKTVTSYRRAGMFIVGVCFLLTYVGMWNTELDPDLRLNLSFFPVLAALALIAILSILNYRLLGIVDGHWCSPEVYMPELFKGSDWLKGVAIGSILGVFYVISLGTGDWPVIFMIPVSIMGEYLMGLFEKANAYMKTDWSKDRSVLVVRMGEGRLRRAIEKALSSLSLTSRQDEALTRESGGFPVFQVGDLPIFFRTTNEMFINFMALESTSPEFDEKAIDIEYAISSQLKGAFPAG